MILSSLKATAQIDISSKYCCVTEICSRNVCHMKLKIRNSLKFGFSVKFDIIPECDHNLLHCLVKYSYESLLIAFSHIDTPRRTW